MSDESIALSRIAVVPAAGWSARTYLSLVSLSIATFALVFSEFLPAGLLTPMAAGLGISEGLAGQTVTATGIAGTFAALLIGFVIRGLDRKPVMLALCSLVVMSNVAAALAPDFATLLLARIAVGVAVGGFWTLVAAVVARLVSIEAIGKGMAIIFVGVSAATIGAPPLAALVATFVGWRAAFVLGAMAGVLALVVELLMLPRLPASEPVRLGLLVGIMRRPKVRVGLVAVLAIAGGHFAGFTYIRPVLETFTRLPAATVAEVLLAFGVANFLGNLASGALVDRRLRTALGGVGVLLAGSAFGLVAYGAQPLPAAILVAVWGFAFGAAPLVLQTWLARAAPDHLEAVGGLLVATFQIAITLGAATGGAIVDRYGVADVLAFTGAAGLLAAALSVVRLR
jgi:MFS transporter, DHA1 family, purine ribonucleoside efflux pump